MNRLLAVIALCTLAACAAPPAVPEAAQSTSAALLIGEQHDAPEHQLFHREAIQALAERGVLAAVALEMAEQGASTAGLAAQASEEQVRQALRWNEQGWPWASYGPAVMAAVGAGVPVIGANLPRDRMRAAMDDSALDALLPGPALKAQQQAIRLGHCGLLPETQIQPMTRVQIARDRAMAQTLVAARVPGKTVVLLAGAGHVDPQLGVPQHLPAGFENKSEALPAGAQPQKDYCEDMRRGMAK
ncbi:MAG: ChaN family lipoprotein [Burkholderiales bacterium]|nr:ChaN family lipoprotein [Burkholderiales bacterium]